MSGAPVSFRLAATDLVCQSSHLRVDPDGFNHACSHHRGVCAYAEMAPDRCPWCHTLWTSILTRRLHSCETAQVWPWGERHERTEQAAQMRRQASLRVDWRAFSHSTELTPDRLLTGAQSTSEQVAA